jgi:hypothetical protein
MPVRNHTERALMRTKNDGPFQDEGYKGLTDADIIWKLDMRKELGVAQLYMAASSPLWC